MSSYFVGGFVIGQKIAQLEAAIAGSSAVEIGSRLDEVEVWQSGRTKFIYPNGGAEALPKELSKSTVYQEVSPFGVGVNFSATAEYFSPDLGEWVKSKTMPYEGSVAGSGVLAFARPAAGLVVVTTGQNSLGTVAKNGGNWEGRSDFTGINWRVRCVRED